MTSAHILLGLALRVCADPNNLPFSNQQSQGFENRIAQVVARDLGMQLEYTWWSQRKNFIDKTIRAGKCDVIMGLPEGYPGILETRPYYQSSYVFVYPNSLGIHLRTLTDPALRKLRIGV